MISEREGTPAVKSLHFVDRWLNRFRLAGLITTSHSGRRKLDLQGTVLGGLG